MINFKSQNFFDFIKRQYRLGFILRMYKFPKFVIFTHLLSLTPISCAENSNVIYLCSIMLFYVFINKLFFKKTESLLFEKLFSRAQKITVVAICKKCTYAYC